MHFYIISSLAILAISLPLRKALAGQHDMRRRTVVLEDVIISEDVVALEEPDGSFVTDSTLIIGTKTIYDMSPVSSSTASNTKAAITAPIKDAIVAPQKSTTVAIGTSVPTVSSPTASRLAEAPNNTVSALSTPGPKRGLAYNDISLLSGFLGFGSQSSWCYNWASRPDGTVPGDLEYVPMLWGLDSSLTSVWDTAVMQSLQSGSTHLLSFNEPDISPSNHQSNINFTEAANGYYTYMEKFAGKARLGSPAVTNGDPASGMGLGWLTNFLQACEALGCTIDFVAIHWYDSASNVDYFKEHIMQAYSISGHRPIWITEFSASGSDADQQAFLEAVIPWLDSQSFVERYAYFMVANGSLISGNSVSALGHTFAFLPS